VVLIKRVEITHYRGVKHANLDGLRDLNILIGPNNCGKTSILQFLSRLTQINVGSGYICDTCNAVKRGNQRFAAPYFMLGTDESFLRKGQTAVLLSFDLAEVEKEAPGVLERQRKDIQEARACAKDEMTFRFKDSMFLSEHISPTHDSVILGWLNRTVLYLPEERLQRYKDKSIREYINALNLEGTQSSKWVSYLKNLVDTKIDDHTSIHDLVRNIDGERFQASLEDQGSGVRSLACLLADIIKFDRAGLILIDEPELGLNPRSKQILLSFLLELKGKQVVMATHDPTFVNPLLWKSHQVSGYIFSSAAGEFVKVNLDENEQDPETFAGYLPHTTSLKDLHVYVEGSSDAYILDVFFRKYVKKARKNWGEILSRTGIFHLGGDFWPHILGTIPENPPYTCLAILDGDKRDQVKRMFSEKSQALEGFVFCDETQQVERSIGSKKVIYCWTEADIEDYLDGTKIRSPYNKKIDGPRIADGMKQVPTEMQKLFNVILAHLTKT